MHSRQKRGLEMNTQIFTHIHQKCQPASAVPLLLRARARASVCVCDHEHGLGRFAGQKISFE